MTHKKISPQAIFGHYTPGTFHVHSIKKVLILEYTELPPHLKENINHRYNFRNDVLLRIHTELEFGDGSFSHEGIESWRTDPYLWDEEDTFTQSFDSFVKEMGLELEVWIMDNFDLTGVEEIFVNICW